MAEPIWLYQFRLILIGDSTVGKSSLLRRFTDGKFIEYSDPTVGVDFFARLMEVEPGKRVKLQLWDTAGQERFRSITRSYYRNSVGAVLVYDVTNRKSFEHLESWWHEAKQHTMPHNMVFILVGHKIDLASEREVSQEEGQQFARTHDMSYLETSAKNAENVEKAFWQVTREIYELVEMGVINTEEGWEGVKSGMMPRSYSTVPLSAQQDNGGEKKCLCS
ncbi:ras-related protein Rab-39B-like [Branchiostoma floridae x Branchiostoma japonicum]|uniref:Ras-related protein Rab-39B n=1 Tax=Branchiostoma floridae TaxID=7739 RepID=C3YX87_BRAFL|eukprot:XP_002599093.1 hypothetical protein BRAFLDRAFT_114662 [Branchiostoma floridae]